jgi:hypothetical protein
MDKTRLAPYKGRRLFVVCGGGFVVAGTLLAWLNEPDRPPRHSAPSLAFAGRLVSRLDSVSVAGQRVIFVQANASIVAPGRGWGSTRTDAQGRFHIDGGDSFRGAVHVFVYRNEADLWSFRPVKDLMLPARQPVELELIDGVTAVGRVVRQGAPVEGARMGVTLAGPPSERFSRFSEVKSDERGAFTFHHLLEHSLFKIWSRAGALADHGVVEAQLFQTGADGMTLDLGDLEVGAGCSLAGRVVFATGVSPRPQVVVEVFAHDREGDVRAVCDEGGRFELKGVPRGSIILQLDVQLARHSPGVGASPSQPGAPVAYQLAASNLCRDPRSTFQLEGRIERDITGLTILVEPVDPRAHVPKSGPIDASLLARFEEARRGPITGAPSHSGF